MSPSERVNTEEDFINLPRFNYSLRELLEKYPDGVPEGPRGDRLIGRALCMSEEEVRVTMDSIIRKLRRVMV